MVYAEKTNEGMPRISAPREREAGRFRREERTVRGQTLIALLFFILVGIIVTAAAAIILGINAVATAKLTQGEIARELAETGAENALITLLRNKNYTGETLTVGDDTIVVTVTGTTTKVINSVGTSGDFIRKVQVTASYDGVLIPTSWKEIF